LKTLFKYFTIFLLLFNGLGAFYGGISFIIDPTGALLQMSDSFLENSPFDSYLIPGIVLLCVNGIYNFITLYIFLIKKSNAYLFLEIQGILLTGWIIVQMLLLQLFYPLFHIPFLFIGIYFILYSLSQKKQYLTTH
jgi:hypothetical protein